MESEDSIPIHKRSSSASVFPLNIQEVYKDKCVFITGVTGFLGKVLLEKLLRSCPGIRIIYVLLRPKKEENPKSRLASLLNNKVFDTVRAECPEALEKIILLPGDITLECFGLPDEYYNKMITDVQIMFHCAANVRFDDEPINTLKINLLGVQNALHLCAEMKKLEAFVYVSTAFSFCNHAYIDETIYPERGQPRQVLRALKWMSKEDLRKFCNFFIGDRPSLYHFSKAMAEILIQDIAEDLPVIIVRPSIVTPAVAEPFPGWIDNYNGPTGFIVACGKGIVRTLLVKPKVNADWMPVDTACNTLIVAAYYMVITRTKKDVQVKRLNGDYPVINCVCPNANLISWQKVTEICLPYLIEYPSITVYGLPGGTVTSCAFRYYMCLIFSHYFPAFLMDLGTILGNKQRMVHTYNKIHRVMFHMQHYTTHPYTFGHRNLDLLHNQMQPEDQKNFPIYLENLNWTEYIRDYVLGVRRYYLKESDETLPEARIKMNRIYLLWLLAKTVSATGILYVILKHSYFKFSRNSLFSISFVSATEYVQRQSTKLLKRI